MAYLFMKKILTIIAMVSFVFVANGAAAKEVEQVESNLFFYSGIYSNFGTAEDLGAEIAKHDVAVLTHAYDTGPGGENWVNGNCVDYFDELLPEAIQAARAINPDVELYGYIAATADHTECYDPYNNVQVGCPDGVCTDVISWVNRWLEIEEETGEYIDGIYIDLIGSQFIGEIVRDNVLSYVHLVEKKAMLNVMFGGFEVFFAINSPYFEPKKDSLLFEGFYVADGGYWGPNAVNSGMLAEKYLHPKGIRWAALSTEKGGANYDCKSQNAVAAHDVFTRYGGWAFSYQSSDLGLENKDVGQSCAR